MTRESHQYDVYAKPSTFTPRQVHPRYHTLGIAPPIIRHVNVSVSGTENIPVDAAPSVWWNTVFNARFKKLRRQMRSAIPL